MTFSILLIEDDADLCEELSVFLCDAGLSVRCAGSIAEARASLVEPCAVIVLDILLPDGDGLEFCRQADLGSQAGVVVCTGVMERERRLDSLTHCADAYLTKPVDPEELLAVLHSIQRRVATPTSAMTWDVKPHPWVLDKTRRRLLAPNGLAVRLSASEAIVIEFLFTQKEFKASRPDILTALGRNQDAFALHGLEAMISRLRRKSIDDCKLKLPLVPEYGNGYVFTDHAQMI
jgi:two-component system OmpR family response regulator